MNSKSTYKPRVPQPSAPRQLVVQQGTRTLFFDGTQPATFTPARDGTLTITQGSVAKSLPNSTQMVVGYKGTWPADPPPPPSDLIPPIDPTHVPIMAKPAKGAPWTDPLYGTRSSRVTDHATDMPGSPRMRNDYSRRQPFNCDNTLFVGDRGGGAWAVYRVTGDSWTYLKNLSGPGGDAEIQWSPTDPDLLFYMDPNGGKVIRTYKVSTDTRGIAYDFFADVSAAIGTQDWDHAWTRSEGSPSADNRYWGLIVQKYNQSTGNFDSRGFAVLDLSMRRVVYSATAASDDRPDHVSMSPCGRWFMVAGGSGRNEAVVAYGIAADVLGQTRICHYKSEHSDSGLLPNGHSFFFSVDYDRTQDGDIFWIDLEDGTVTRYVVDTAYHNQANPNTYSMHISAKAYDKPGWVVESREGDPAHACNIMLIELFTGKKYGVGLNFPIVNNYFDEPHTCPDRTLSMLVSNANFNTSLNEDVVCTKIVWPAHAKPTL